MITENDVLKVIVECKKPNGRTVHEDVVKKLGIDYETYQYFLFQLEEKHYLSSNLEDATVNSFGQSVYDDMKPKEKIKKSVKISSVFTLKLLVEIAIGVAIAVIGSFLIYHFRWQQP